MKTIKARYTEGFNNGYLLAQHNPSMLTKLLEKGNSHEYLQALKDGQKTYEQERSQSRIQELPHNDSREIERER